MQRKLKDLLHQYKLEVFRVEHHQKNPEQITKECMAIRDELLKQQFHYHFHKLPDANRAEIINMIDNYIREAVLPPIVEKLVHRQVLLEKRVASLERLLELTLETLTSENAPVESTR
ncbi:MAG: hypothetical protein FJ299_10235 [Planctomycetes bacterium]|nr:hypothetical protein [Planctomycetota bacterium]